MTYDPNAAKADRLVCGCWSGYTHSPDCVLGWAETIATEAVAKRADDDGPLLIVALVALANAGLLRDVPDPDPTEILLGVLDKLWEAELLGPANVDGAR